MFAALVIAAIGMTDLKIYVSPKGKDSYSGLVKVRPVPGLAQALDIVRNERRPGQTATILVDPGEYRVPETLLLDAALSDVTIQGQGPVPPRLTGAIRLSGWRPVKDPAVLARLSPAARGNVVVAGVPENVDLGNLRRRGFSLPRQTAALELFAGGKPMQLARYPNAGKWLKIKAADGPQAFTYDDPVPSTWAHSDDLWAFGYWKYDWAESYESVKAFDPKTGHVALADKPNYEVDTGRRFYFQNVLEALDSPGEWYLDRSNRRLYFWPVGHSDVTASVLSTPMIRAEGAKNVRLENLDLEGGRSSGIEIEGGSKNLISKCVIRNFGTAGVAIQNSPDSAIVGCDLTGLGESAISLNGGDRMTLTPCRMRAEDNHIYAYSRWCRTYQPAIGISGVGNIVRHNTISDAPHNAILLSGNDHVIEYNDIARVCQETGDAGAVYMGRNPTMRGTVIQGNHFHDMVGNVNTAGNYTDVMSVYLDDCWCGTTISGNLFEGPSTGIMIGGGRDNVVENNIFLGKTPAIHLDQRGKGWAAKMFDDNNQWAFSKMRAEVHADQPPYSTHYPPLATLANDDPAAAKGNRFIRNICLGDEWLKLLDGLTTNDFENTANVVRKDKPWSLEDAMRVAPAGFQPLPLKYFGVQSKSRPIDRVKD